MYGATVFWGTDVGSYAIAKNGWIGVSGRWGASAGGSYQSNFYSYYMDGSVIKLNKNAVGRCACLMARKSLERNQPYKVLNLLRKTAKKYGM